MNDFLTFQAFITPRILLIFYYSGAVVAPLVSWLLFKYLKHRYFPSLVLTRRPYLYGAFIFCFLCMELFWRMMFEVMIAYFDMHDALMKMSTGG